ncbi:hypothetical protein [Shimazuella kribbensis]|uniref:hypothetical protein n=1 Tax=Shimazuella kribbensis TaxID=139808 RepID=UPI0014713FC3|nr:hypothetical protein [Shimazuella kribbensis]
MLEDEMLEDEMPESEIDEGKRLMKDAALAVFETKGNTDKLVAWSMASEAARTTSYGY